MNYNLRLSLLGLITGMLSGAFGVGGGFVLVPGLVMFVGYSAREAVGTSLAVVLPTAVASALSYFFVLHGHVNLLVGILLAVGGVFGSYLGVKAVRKVHDRRHAKLFSLLLMLIGILMVNPLSAQGATQLHNPVVLVFLGVLVGMLSGFFGIGGAVVLLPILTLGLGFEFKQAAPISLVTVAIVSAASFLQHHRHGHVNTQALLRMMPPVLAAALVTPYFSVQLPNQALHVVFGFLLIAYAAALYRHNVKKMQTG